MFFSLAPGWGLISKNQPLAVISLGKKTQAILVTLTGEGKEDHRLLLV